MINLKGRLKQKEIAFKNNKTILKLALKHKIDFGFSCTRGTCARCRCLIESGMEYLNAPTDEERERLEPIEIEEGYRLSCQAILKQDGPVTVIHKPYF